MLRMMSKKSTKVMEWDLTGAALCGAVFGMVPVFAHEFMAISLNRYHSVDPFAHVLAELAASSSVGAALFAAASEIRNRIVRRRAGTDR